MYEDDEFERSLRPTDVTDAEPQIFTPDNSDMMDIIFQYLEEPEEEVKVVEGITSRREFNPMMVPSLQRYGVHQVSSQESSPSPTTSLFWESHTVSQTSGLTTPRTLSNSSIRSQKRREQAEGFRTGTQPTSNLLAKRDDKRHVPAPTTSIPQSLQWGAQLERTQSPLEYPTAAFNERNVELVNPPEKRRSQYGGFLGSISERYDRRNSKDRPYRHSTQPPTSVRSDEVGELSQAMPPTYATSYLLPQEVQAYTAPLQWPSQQVPDKSRTNPYDTKPPQYSFTTYWNNHATPSNQNSMNMENSVSTFELSKLPQSTPIDQSIRRYDSFKASLSKIARYEPRDVAEISIRDGKNKGSGGFETIVSSAASIRSRFSLPKSFRTTITNSINQAFPSSHVKELVSLPTPLQISAPIFDNPPRASPRPAPSPTSPPLLSMEYKDTKETLPLPKHYGASKQLFDRRRTPSLRIQIPESTRPLPVRVENGLTQAYEKFRQDNQLPRRTPPQPRIDPRAESPTLPPQRPLPPLPLQTRQKDTPQPRNPVTTPKRYQLADINTSIYKVQLQNNNYTIQIPNSIPRTPVLPTKSTSRLQLSPLHPPARHPSISSTNSPKGPSRALSLFTTQFLTPPSPNLSILLSRHPSSNSSLTWSITSTLSSPSQLLSINTYPHSRTRKSTFSTASSLPPSAKVEPLFVLQRRWGSTRVAETEAGEELFSVRDIGFEDTMLFVVEFGEGMGERREDGRVKEKEKWLVKSDRGNNEVEIVSDGVVVGRVGVVGRNGAEREGRGYDYMIEATPGCNYAVLVALVTVFDDWRMDHFI